jgi:hypothetical protein
VAGSQKDASRGLPRPDDVGSRRRSADAVLGDNELLDTVASRKLDNLLNDLIAGVNLCRTNTFEQKAHLGTVVATIAADDQRRDVLGRAEDRLYKVLCVVGLAKYLDPADDALRSQTGGEARDARPAHRFLRPLVPDSFG